MPTDAMEMLGIAAVVYIVGMYLRRRLRIWLAGRIPPRHFVDGRSLTSDELERLHRDLERRLFWSNVASFWACFAAWHAAVATAFHQQILRFEPWVVFPFEPLMPSFGNIGFLFYMPLILNIPSGDEFAEAVRELTSQASRSVRLDRFASLGRWKMLFVLHGSCALSAIALTPTLSGFSAAGVLSYDRYTPWPSVRPFDSIQTICVAERSETGKQKLNQRVEDGWAVGFRFADGSYWSSLGYRNRSDYDEAALRRAVERVSQESGRPITPVDIVWRAESAAKNRWRKRNGFKPNACSDASARTGLPKFGARGLATMGDVFAKNAKAKGLAVSPIV